MFFNLFDDYPDKTNKEARKDKRHFKKRDCMDCSGLFINLVDKHKKNPADKCHKKNRHEDCRCKNLKFKKCKCHDNWHEMKHHCECRKNHDNDRFPINHKCRCNKDMNHNCKCHKQNDEDWHSLYQHHSSNYQLFNHHENWHHMNHHCNCQKHHHNDDWFFMNRCRKCHHMNHHCRCHQNRQCFDCHDLIRVNLNGLRNDLNIKLFKNRKLPIEIVTTGGYRIGGKTEQVGIDYLDLKKNDYIITILKDKIDHIIWSK